MKKALSLLRVFVTIIFLPMWIVLIPGYVVIAVALGAGHNHITEAIQVFYNFMKWGFQYDLSIEGIENYDRKKSCVIVANHQSFFDIPVTYNTFKGNVRMIAKKEVFKVPVLGMAMKAAGTVSIDRGNKESAKKAMTHLKELVGQGLQMWIAAEGKRSHDGELLPFKKGAFYTAIEQQVPIIPTVYEGTKDIMPKGAYLARPGKNVRVKILAPISTSGMTTEHVNVLMNTVREQMLNALGELRRD